MSTLLCLLIAAATAAAQITTQPAPTPTRSVVIYSPTTSSADSWECATKNITTLLKPPKPTGALLEAFNDHADSIYAECEKTVPTPFTKFPACTSMAKSNCLTTVAPSPALTAYSVYGSSISSWWAARSTELPEVKENCPNTWEDAKWDVIGGEVWLNATIALAECFAGNGTGEKAAQVSGSAAVQVPSSTGPRVAEATGGAAQVVGWNVVGVGAVVAALVL